MKVSEITTTTVAEYLRCDTTDSLLAPILIASKEYIKDYTSLAIEDLDNYDSFWIVVLVLCQSMYDDRSAYVDKSNVNKVVETILNMHRRNLVGG